jgi:hypothetical protein
VYRFVANSGGASKVGSTATGVDGRKESLKAGCFVAQLLVSSASRIVNPAMDAGER